MDYSLLLGIQKQLSPHNDKPESSPGTIFNAHLSNSATLYYVGVIDILQKWDK